MQTRAAARCAAEAEAALQAEAALPDEVGLPAEAQKGSSATNDKKRQAGDTKPRAPAQPMKRRKMMKQLEPAGPSEPETTHQEPEALPHGLGSIHRPKKSHTADLLTPEANKQIEEAVEEREGKSDRVIVDDSFDASGVEIKKAKQPRRTKDNPYGLMPGRTPYPDHTSPTPEQCQEVHDILTELHGVFKSPDKIPPPSTEVAGCGEVPDLVDAMIRTLISGHTTMGNANKAIQDVITHYGQLDGKGIGAGSIDWNHVRHSPENEVIQTIRRAGLANTKGKKIKEILDMVYEENQARKLAYVKEKETGEEAGAPGSAKLTQGQKDHQLLKIENGILTMDHVRGMTTNEAMLEFTKYPGIGVKTASCLVLFCLQQPSFAVDTHVWRMCKWLGWVPPKASRDDAYMHCELRVPGHLKYGLHQLFIQHGKSCGRCRTITVEGTADWTTATCPLEHLLDRFDKRQTKAQPKKISQKRVKIEISENFADTEAEEKAIVSMADEEHETQVRDRGFEEEDSDLSQDLTEDSRSTNETYEPEMMEEHEANQNEEIVADSEKLESLRLSHGPSSIVDGYVQEQTEFRTQVVVELQQTLHKREVEVAEPPADVISRRARAARRSMLREQRESA